MKLQVVTGGQETELNVLTEAAIAAHDQSSLAHPDIRLLLGPGAYGVKMTATGGGFGAFVLDTETSEPASSGDVDELSARVLVLEGGLVNLEGDVGTLSSGFADQVTLTTAMNSSLASTTAALEALEAKVTEYHTGGVGVVMNATGGQFGDFTPVVEEVTGGGDTSELEQAINELAADHVTLGVSVNSLWSEFNSEVTVVSALSDRVGDLEDGLDSVTSDLTLTQGSVSSAVASIGGLQDSVTVVSSDLEALASKVTDFHAGGQGVLMTLTGGGFGGFTLVDDEVSYAPAGYVQDLEARVVELEAQVRTLSALVVAYHNGFGVLMTATGGGFGAFVSVTD